MILEGGIYSFAIPAGRTIAGFFIGAMLGIVGGWFASSINALFGTPWVGTDFFRVYLFCIGAGAGIGAYVGWINLSIRWYMVATTLLLAIVGGVVGSNIGFYQWETFTEESYMGPRDTQINVAHFAAPICAIVVSTVFGLYYHFRTRG